MSQKRRLAGRARALQVVMSTNPGVALVTLTLAVSMVFFVSGITECMAAFQVRPEGGWGWMPTGTA